MLLFQSSQQNLNCNNARFHIFIFGKPMQCFVMQFCLNDITDERFVHLFDTMYTKYGNQYGLNYVLVIELPVRIGKVTVRSRPECATVCKKWVSCDNFQYLPENDDTHEGNCFLLEWIFIIVPSLPDVSAPAQKQFVTVYLRISCHSLTISEFRNWLFCHCIIIFKLYNFVKIVNIGIITKS